jgi:hypothetical protein
MELEKQEIIRNTDGTFPKGTSGNPNGRPRGQTLKEYIRQRFLAMTDEEKDAFMAKLEPIDLFKMAEGNPHNTQDLTSKDEKIGIGLTDEEKLKLLSLVHEPSQPK